MASWNYRLVEHRYKDERTYLPHECWYDENGKLNGFSAREQSPCCKVEAKKILEAFDKPIAFWVDEETVSYKRVGNSLFPDWEKYGKYETEVYYSEGEADKGPVSDEEDLGDVS